MESYKVVILGDSGVGKTSLIQMYSRSSFETDTLPTIKCDVETKVEKIGDRQIELKIWDTAGQEKYFSLVKNFLRDTTVAVIVGDLTNEGSIQNISKWEEQLKQEVPTAEVVIAINKSDLGRTNPKLISKAKDLLVYKYTDIYVVSAVTGNNVQPLFHCVANKCANIGFNDNVAKKAAKNSKGGCC